MISDERELNSMVFKVPVPWFVYRGEERHVWHFVHFCEAQTGDEALESARREAVSLGNDVTGHTYMAAAAPAISTRKYE